MRVSRQLLIAAALIVSSATGIAADKRPTGMADGNLYHDSGYGFTIQKYDNWKFGKIDNEDPAKPRLTRCIITQKSVTYPAEYYDNEDKFSIPVIAVFADTSSLPVDAYAAELADRKSKLESRKQLIKDFAVLGKGSFVDKAPTTVDGQKAVLLHFRQDYEVQLYNRIKDQYKLKEDAILGDVYVTKRDNNIVIIALSCEREIFRTVNEEAKTMIQSLDLDPPADSSGGDDAGTNGQ